MRRLTIALAVLLTGSLVYCDDPTGVMGALGFGVVEGREQTVSADEASLDPVRAKVWRDASGQAFIGVGASPLYAQTGVKGVANAVVCVGENPIEGDPIIPHSRCTMSDSEGNATFHLTHPKRAGTHRTGIVAEVDGEALTPDTVTAEVVAGAAVAEYERRGGGLLRSSQPRSTEGLKLAVDQYGNPVPTCLRFEATDTLASAPAEWPDCREISWALISPERGVGLFTVHDSTGTQVGHGAYEITDTPPDYASTFVPYAYGMASTCRECEEWPEFH